MIQNPPSPDALDDEVQEALSICGGDAMAALRITLIANAFLEAEIDRLYCSHACADAGEKIDLSRIEPLRKARK